MSDTPQGPGWWQASDGRYYPPQAPPPPPYQQAYAPQPTQNVVVKTGCGKWILAAVIVALLAVGGCVAVLAIGGKAAVDEVNKQTGKAAASDYDITGPNCKVAEITGLEADGTITNTSNETQGFQITVRFESGNTLVSEDSTFTDSIKPGQSFDYRVIPLKSEVPAGTTCTLTEVRYTIFDSQNEGK